MLKSGPKEERIGSTRRDDYRCSSMNALQLVALVESASKLRGGAHRAKSDQSDFVLLQVKETR